MASLFTPPYFDVGAGITPADGALLNFYVVGSGTRKNTFTTAAATTPHANPVVADTLGVFPAIYIQGENDWVLTDKNAVQKNTGSVSELATAKDNAFVKNFITLAAAVASTTLQDGDTLTTGDRYGSTWEVKLLSTGAANTFNRVAWGNNTGAATDLVLVLRTNGIYNVKEFGAIGNNSTNDTAAIQATIDAVNEFEGIYFPPGDYLVTAELDFTAKKNFSVKGEFRASILRVNHSDESCMGFENPSFTVGGTPQRGIIIENISIYSSATGSSLPLIGLQVVNCPEIKIQNCTFIDCATVAQVSIDECWCAIFEFNFVSARENLVSTHGAPNNTASGGIAVYIPSECHAMTIQYCRIRTGSPGISYTGGDATEIRLNAIESNLTNGIHIAGSCQAITIDRNYFEGGQTYDIRYLVAGTNFGHTISNNYFHAVNGIEFLDGCNTQGIAIRENTFYSGVTGVTFGAITGSSGVHILDNTFRDMSASVSLPASSLLSAGLSYPDNAIRMTGNAMVGTTSNSIGRYNDTLLDNVNPIATFSGTGTVGVSTVTHSGVSMYEFVETGAGTYIVSVDYDFDNSMQGKHITLNMPCKVTSGNVTVTLDDGVATKAFTLNAGAIGADATESMFYHLLSATADKIRVRISVSSGLTVQTLMPSVRIGLHDDIKYTNSEREKTKTDTAALTAVANTVNTSGKKVEGYRRYNSNTGLFVIAAGNADGSVWVYEGTGATAHTPV